MASTRLWAREPSAESWPRDRAGQRGVSEGTGIDAAPLAYAADDVRQGGASAIFMAIGGKVTGTFAISDQVKASTPFALAALLEQGITIVMLTGGNEATVQAVVRQLRIDQVEAEILPDQKSAVVSRDKSQG